MRFSTELFKLCEESQVERELVFYGNGGSAAESEINEWLENLTL